ncbi:MAG TPA: DJ-1/PfpI family protein [Candidatus Aquicultor sp.]|jgi:protease I
MQARGKTVAMLLPNHYNANLFDTLRDCIVGGGGKILIAGFQENEPLTDSMRKEVVTIDVDAQNLSPGDYNALVIVDSSTPEEMIASRKNLNLIRRSYESQKIIGTVDSGVELLIAAIGSLLSGRKVTGSEASRIDLESIGAVFIDKDVVVDEYLITARSVEDAEEFCQVLLDRLQAVGDLAA